MFSILVFFSSLLALALSVCVLPPVPSSAPFPTAQFNQVTLPNGHIQFECPSDYYTFGNFGDRLFFEMTEGLIATSFTCNPVDGKFTEELKLTTMTCAQPVPPINNMCFMVLLPSTKRYAIINDSGDVKCPAGQVMKALGKEATRINCESNKFYGRLSDGVYDLTQTAEIECLAAPPAEVSPSQLWSINYYYNYAVGVHAFCADQVCIDEIQKNGIGYDMVKGKGLMGNAVSETMIDSVRASCPTGSANLKHLGFTKSGNKYLHNFNGTGLKQGWVSIANGSCGANVPIKRWKSKYSDDMMYGVNLEWNAWYTGMVQDGGAVQFYLW